MLDMSQFIVGRRYQDEGFNEKLPTGIPVLDVVMGGGFTFNGTIMQLWGPNASGKTTLAYRLCKKVTDKGGYITWLDAEASYDSVWARRQGLNPDQVICYRPSYREECFKLICDDARRYREIFLPWLDNPDWKGDRDKMLDEAPYHTIVIDSIAATPMKSLVDSGNVYAEGMASEARANKAFLKTYQAIVAECPRMNMVIINQVFDKIGTWMGGQSFGGGNFLKHALHFNLRLRAKPTKGQYSDTWNYVTMEVVKNKLTPVGGIKVPIWLSKSDGFHGVFSIVEFIRDNGMCSGGSWKKMDIKRIEDGRIETVKWQKDDRLISQLYEDHGLFMSVIAMIRDKFLEVYPDNPQLVGLDITSILDACLGERESESSVDVTVDDVEDEEVVDE